MNQLTIVIPCLDERELLERCLWSVACRLPQQRVLVVQMGDWRLDPALYEVLDIRLLRTTRKCAAAARNFGAREAETDYLLFLDSDNWLEECAEGWGDPIARALAAAPHLIVLQRAEHGRSFRPTRRVSRWNFSRHCIEWNLIWRRSHFLELGALDEDACSGSARAAQAGEAFDLCYRHFAQRQRRTVCLPTLRVGHPSLDVAGRSTQRRFEYAYGSHYVAVRQLRRSPSLLSLFWALRTMAGCLRDIGWALLRRQPGELRTTLFPRLLGVWDGLLLSRPRERGVR